MSALNSFQSDVSDALLHPEVSSPAIIEQRDSNGNSRRFNIYRNNRAASLIDALSDTYPVLFRLLGEDFFRAAAREYIDQTPPVSPVLHEYGADFGGFVQSLPGSANFPYLRDMGQLEWARLCAYHAADDVVLRLEDLSAMPAESLLSKRLIATDALQLVQSRWAVGSIWSVLQSNRQKQNDLNVQQAESVMITRPSIDVNIQLLSVDGVEFLQLLLAGESIADSAEKQLQRNPVFDTGSHLQGLIASGAFAAMEN